MVLHPGELLPPVCEVAEGVRAGEVRGGGSHLQGEHVVHHLAQTDVTGERRERRGQHQRRLIFTSLTAISQSAIKKTSTNNGGVYLTCWINVAHS